ncbi:MAG TPA: DUF6807 family protein [Verrucomicrobiae bacterium]|nr:DUF6807 family protein [Verrucomicrobiae bacterium]
MRPIGPILAATAVFALARNLSAAAFAVEHRPDRLIITHEAKPVAHFVFADTNILRPYFAHVHTPDGIPVTRNHPPVAGVDPVDHPTMHPGIWLAFGNISGQDFWRNKATIRHEKFTITPETFKNQLTFATESSLVSTNGEPLAKLNSTFLLISAPDGYLLSWRALFEPLVDNFNFGDQEEMGFGARVATPLSEKNGGAVKNSAGLTGAKNAWAKTAEWCDYSGPLSNRLVGITVMSDPKNFRPSWFHCRDYGLVVANPFGRKAFTKGEPSSVLVEKGEIRIIRFGAFIHSSPTNQPPDLNAAYKIFASQ